MPSMKMQANGSRAALMVSDSAKILKRFYFLQRECVLAQAGWMPGTVHWETKLLWPEFLWQDALTATALRERVLELRYPERKVEPGTDAALLERWRSLLRNAPGDAAFAEAIHGAVKPFLRGLYGRYLAAADRLDDAPTVRILRQALEDIDEQISRLAEARADVDAVLGPGERDAAREWAGRVGAALAAIGQDAFIADAPPSVPSMDPSRLGGRDFAIARLGRRDPRFSYSRIPWRDSLDPSVGAGEGFELQVRQAQAHLNEVWAAEMAAAVLFDLADDGPAEFLQEAARWCFDEIRHCRMGYTRFREWGFEKPEMPIGSFAYDAGEKVDAVTRLGIIFYFETTYIHTKPERVRSFGEFGDRTSSHDMDFDWADELIHSHYGKKWLEFFIRKNGLQLTPADVKRAAEGAIARIRAGATDADRRRVEDLYQATMARARQLASVPVTA